MHADIAGVQVLVCVMTLVTHASITLLHVRAGIQDVWDVG